MKLWKEHDALLSELIHLEEADFRGLIFRNHRFRKQNFRNCDFSGSRWLLAGIHDADCSGSNFSGITTMLFDLENMDCTGCNFSNATLSFGNTIDGTKFCGADFSGATLKLSKQFHKSKTPPDFTGAIMDGCTFINESTHEHGALGDWFTESQRSAMSNRVSNKQTGISKQPDKRFAEYPFWGYADLLIIVVVVILALVICIYPVSTIVSSLYPQVNKSVLDLIVGQFLNCALFLGVASIYFRRRYQEPFLRGLRFERVSHGLVSAVLLGVQVLGLVTAEMMTALGYQDWKSGFGGTVPGSIAFWIISITSTTLEPFTEEALFRGDAIQPVVVRSAGAVLGISVTALLYGLMLLPQFGLTQWWASALVMSATLGWIRYRTGSITTAAIAHAVSQCHLLRRIPVATICMAIIVGGRY